MNKPVNRPFVDSSSEHCTATPLGAGLKRPRPIRTVEIYVVFFEAIVDAGMQPLQHNSCAA